MEEEDLLCPNCSYSLEGGVSSKPRAKWNLWLIISILLLVVGGILTYLFLFRSSSPVAVGIKWGFIDKTGKFAINPQFGWAEPFSHGIARVWLEWAEGTGRYGCIDQSGHYVWEPEAN